MISNRCRYGSFGVGNARSQRTCRQCSLAQAALSVWSRIGRRGRQAMRWQCDRLLARAHSSMAVAAGGGCVGGGGVLWRWWWWRSFFFALLLWWVELRVVVAIWDDATAIGVKVFPQGRALGRALTWRADGNYVHTLPEAMFCNGLLQMNDHLLYSSLCSPLAVCCHQPRNSLLHPPSPCIIWGC